MSIKQKQRPCPKCRELVSPQATKCPHCHSKIQSEAETIVTGIVILIAIVLALWFWGC